MDVLTGDGRGRHRARRRRARATCSTAFPNSYGSLGYALRLRIELEPVSRTSRCGTCGSTTLDAVARRRSARSARPASTTASRSTSSTAPCSAPAECYLTLGSWADDAPYASATTPGQQIYYRSIQQRAGGLPDRPRLPLALGHRLVLVLAGLRRAEPAGPAARGRKRWRRSDVYWRLVALERRYGVMAGSTPGAGRPAREEVVQDVEIPVDRLAGLPRLLPPRDRHRAGVAVPAAAARPGRRVGALPARARPALRQRRLLVDGGAARRASTTATTTALIEARSRELGGRKSLYSTAFYDERRRSGRTYGGAAYDVLKKTLRPGRPVARPVRQDGPRPLTSEEQATMTLARCSCELVGAAARHSRFAAYDGSAAGPADAAARVELQLAERALRYLVTAPGDARPRPRLRHAATSTIRGRPVRRADGCWTGASASCPGRSGCACSRDLGPRALRRPAAAAGGVRRRAGCAARLRHSKARDAAAISHHYDVSNRFYEWVLGPSMAYTCAVYPTADVDARGGAGRQVRPGRRKLGLQPGMRLLDVGCGWGGMVRHAAQHYGVTALGVTLSRQQAEWAQTAIASDGLAERRRGAAPGLPRRRRERLRRGLARSA